VGDLGSSSARRERTGGGSDHLGWGRRPSLPPSTRGGETKGEDADAASASRLDGELVAPARVAAVACRSSAMAPPRGVSVAGAASSSTLLLPRRRRWRVSCRGCGGDGGEVISRVPNPE
jgi:hypothetical protein